MLPNDQMLLIFRVLYICKLGVKVQNMKMDFNTGGTWCRVGQCILIMKIYDFFYSAQLFSCLEIIAKMEDFLHITKRLSRIKKS